MKCGNTKIITTLQLKIHCKCWNVRKENLSYTVQRLSREQICVQKLIFGRRIAITRKTYNVLVKYINVGQYTQKLHVRICIYENSQSFHKP